MPPPDKTPLLVLIPNWIGDAAMCTPALRALHRRFPEKAICIAGRGAPCDLLAGLPWVAHCVRLPTRPGLRGMVRCARMLAPYAAGQCVIFPHAFRSALLARLSGAPARIAYDRGFRGWLLTKKVAPHREDGKVAPIYMADEYLNLVATLGCEDDDGGLELHAPEDDVRAVREGLAGDGPVVGFAPGAAFGPSKCWPVERYAAVADALAERVGARCVVLTGPGEEATRRAFVSCARTKILVCDDGRPSVARLKATVSELDLLICNDSGARHVAIAFKKPVVCIMGPTSRRYTESRWEVGEPLQIDVDCGPCQKPVCATDHRCMTRISSGDVLGVALAYLPLCE